MESLIEQRLISDATADPCLSEASIEMCQSSSLILSVLLSVVRLSIGLEDLEDLKEDFRRASAAVLGRSSSKL